MVFIAVFCSKNSVVQLRETNKNHPMVFESAIPELPFFKTAFEINVMA
jgi:hypothetical protein